MTPESEQLRREKIEAALTDLDALAEEIATGWTAEKSGIEILEDMREEREQSLRGHPNNAA